MTTTNIPTTDVQSCACGPTCTCRSVAEACACGPDCTCGGTCKCTPQQSFAAA